MVIYYVCIAVHESKLINFKGLHAKKIPDPDGSTGKYSQSFKKWHLFSLNTNEDRAKPYHYKKTALLLHYNIDKGHDKNQGTRLLIKMNFNVLNLLKYIWMYKCTLYYVISMDYLMM